MVSVPQFLISVKIRTWMYVSEVAKRLRRCERTIRRYIEEGKLIGGKPDRGSRAGVLVLGASVVELEKKMIENMQEDAGAIDEEMAKIMEKHPERKVYSKVS
jgi:predicted transcriptional regulator